MVRFLKSLLLSLMLVSMLTAGGFELYEFGAAASGMAGAVVARPWDASTVFYNPAGIAFLPNGSHIYGDLTLISATSKWTGAEPVFSGEEHTSKDQIHTPIGFFFSHQFSPSLYAGISVTNPFGLGLAWQEDFPGRSISFNTDLKSFYISPVFTYKVSDAFSISAGLDVVLGTVVLERYVRLFDSEGSPGYEVAKSKIEGNSDPAFGFTASMMYHDERFGFGLLYRHSVKNKLTDADATFSFLDNYATPLAMANLKDQKVSSSISFPGFVAGGLYYQFLDQLGAEIDFFWYNWSVFDQLVFDFEELPQTVVEENYENSIQLRLGVHYDIGTDWQLRVGYIYDQTPQPVESISPLLPDNNRHDFSFGLGYNKNNWKFDAGYMLVDFGERSTVENGVGKNYDGFNGSYTSVANLLFFAVGYHFE
jgi:long-chain fatty acid transport protein